MAENRTRNLQMVSKAGFAGAELEGSGRGFLAIAGCQGKERCPSFAPLPVVPVAAAPLVLRWLACRPLVRLGVDVGDVGVRVQNCRQAIQAFYEMHPEYYNFDMAETRGQQNANGDMHYVSLSKILAQKQQYDEPQFWHIIANMTGRVIQMYISWPLAGMNWPLDSGPTPEDFPNNAPFAMEFICPHEGVVLTSREPLRLWKLLEHPYCAGHYMRILPDNE
ncbi:hypothetical protein CYMTET_18602 [Cymbomonas tetramitiformis]|uniref:Uncharacterized protein n=1 Tax=Cymbomonas tetramitiformis TaxID=36881 RepID=A0AAE0G7N5_9CHLO|nr:hypothetical protein CYMTET_18602 [Cymbomonas tetramitiformis]